jgi:hypothetical protein
MNVFTAMANPILSQTTDLLWATLSRSYGPQVGRIVLTQTAKPNALFWGVETTLVLEGYGLQAVRKCFAMIRL